MVCLTAKDAWRTLRNENAIAIGYDGFVKWVHKLAIKLDPGIDGDALAVLRNYAKVKSQAPGNWRTNKNGIAKVQVLRAIASQPSRTWTGSELIDLAEVYGACSRSTVYRRGEELFGDFSAPAQYTAEQARKIIVGV